MSMTQRAPATLRNVRFLRTAREQTSLLSALDELSLVWTSCAPWTASTASAPLLVFTACASLRRLTNTLLSSCHWTSTPNERSHPSLALAQRQL